MPTQPSAGTIDFITEVKKIAAQNNFATKNLDSLADSILGVDKEAVKAAKSIQKTGGSVEELDRFLVSGSSSTKAFSNAIKSAAINMGAMLAITLAVKAAIYILDELYTSFEEQQEIVNDLTTEIEELKQEYDTLKEDPSTSGKKLEHLKRELEYKEDLLKLEKERLALKYMDEEMPETKEEQENIISGAKGGIFNYGSYDELTKEGILQSKLDNLTTVQNKIKELDEQGVFGKNLAGWETKEANAIDDVSEALGDVKERYLEISAAKETLEGYIEDGLLTGAKAEKAKEKIASFQAEMDELDPIILNAELAIGEAHFTEYYDQDLNELLNSTILADGNIGGNLSSDNITDIADDLKELNQSLRDGEIATDGWFTAIERLVSDNSLDEAIRSVEDWSTSATDGLEAMITTMVSQLTNGMTEASNAFLRGETSVTDYIDELEAGSEAQLQMLETTYDLTVDEKGFAKAVSKDGKKISKAAEDAADAYNELKDSVDELSDVKGLADALSSDEGFLENYKSWTEDLFDNQDFQTYIDGLSNSIIDWIGDNEQKAQQFAQSLQGTVSQTVDATKFLSDDANAYLKSITGDNMDATTSMAGFAIDTVAGTISNSTEAVGTVIGALGDLISNFDYKLEATPYMTGNVGKLLEFDEDGNYKLSPLPTFGFDISGSAQGNTAAALSKVKEAANYFKTSGAKAAASAAKNPKNYTTTSSPTASKNPNLLDDDDDDSDGTGTGSGGSGSGSGSSKDPHVAEVDKYKNLTDAVDEYDRKLEQLDRVYDNTDSIDERIALKQQEIKLYQEQKDAIDALNQARDSEITDLVEKLRGQGFQIDYDPSTEYLLIKNREHINDLNQDIIEEYEDYIVKVDELNDANKDSADQWDELTYSIIEASKAIEELEQEKYEDYIETAEHILRLMENRKDSLGKESSVYLDMMNTTLNRWSDLVKTDYTGNLDQIRELEAAWMDFYDERIEKEKEILELQLDDNDAILDAVIKVIDDQIDALDDQIDGLRKANDERKKALELQKAQVELDKQRNQKTRQVLRKSVGWVWEVDEDAIKEAEENLADLEYDAKIDALEDEKEALEDLKEKWEEIPDIFENEQNKLLMIQRFGANAEEDILNDRIGVYEGFKDDYIDIQQQIQDKTDELEDHTSAAYLNVVKAFEAMAKLSNIGLENNTTSSNAWYVNKDGKAPSQAQVGDIVYTKGGTYKILAKDENGKFTSEKIDNNSANISEDMWGKSAGIISNSVDNIVRVNEDIVEQTAKQILTDEGLQKYVKDNTTYTIEEIDTLLGNTDVTSLLSDYTDTNSEATDDNTNALYDLSTALNNFSITGELTEEDPFSSIDFDSLNSDESNYIKQLQTAYQIALDNGNQTMAEGILSFLQDFKDGFGDEYIQIGKDTYTAATSPYSNVTKSKVDSESRLSSLEKMLESASDASEDYIARLERAIAIEKYGSGTEQYSSSNGYMTQTITVALDEKEMYMTADEIKQKYDYLNGIDNDYDADEMGRIIAERVAKSIYDSNSEWGSVFTNDLEDILTDAAKESVNSSLGSNIYNTSTKSSSRNKSSSSKSYGATYAESNLSQSDNDAIKSAQKAYNEAKAKGDTVGMEKAHAAAEAIRNKNGYSGGVDGSQVIQNSNTKLAKSINESASASTYAADASYDAADSISKTASDVVDGIKSAVDNVRASINTKSSGSSSSSGRSSNKSGNSSNTTDKGTVTSVKTYTLNNKIYTTTKYTRSDGSSYSSTTTKNLSKKAKGGLNLDADTYNVDEIGAELIINPIEDPVKGRLVTLSYGSNVIPADVSKRIWEMGNNPKEFINDAIGGRLANTNQIVYTAGIGQPNVTNHYTIENVSLPNVAKPEEFWKQLTQNLPNEASQWSKSRTVR